MVIADNQLHTLQTTLLKLLQKLSPVDLRLAESAADPNHLPLAPAVDSGRFQDGHILNAALATDLLVVGIDWRQLEFPTY